MDNSNARGAARLIDCTPVDLSILGGGQIRTVLAHILELSGHELLLRAPIAAPCGSPVRIETGDTLLLGEISRCEPRGDQCRIAVRVRHSLTGLAELERLNRALLGTPQPDRRTRLQPADSA